MVVNRASGGNRNIIRTIRETGSPGLFGLFISTTLLGLHLAASYLTASMQLWILSLGQGAVTMLLLFLWLTREGRLAPGQGKSCRDVVALFTGCGVMLLAGYLVLEIGARLHHPPRVGALAALLTALLGLTLNGYLIHLLLQSRLLDTRFGSFRLPAAGLLLMSAGMIAGLLLTLGTHVYMLDAIFALLGGLVLLAWSFFTMVDAYWQILEISR